MLCTGICTVVARVADVCCKHEASEQVRNLLNRVFLPFSLCLQLFDMFEVLTANHGMTKVDIIGGKDTFKFRGLHCRFA